MSKRSFILTMLADEQQCSLVERLLQTSLCVNSELKFRRERIYRWCCFISWYWWISGISEGSWNILNYTIVLHCIAVCCRNFLYYTVTVLFPCLRRIMPRTLLARAPVFLCRVQRQSPGLETTSAAFTHGERFLGRDGVDEVAQHVRKEVSHAHGCDMRFVYQIINIVVILAFVLKNCGHSVWPFSACGSDLDRSRHIVQSVVV